MIDITNEFFSYTNERPNHHEPVVNKSAFLQSSQSIEYELTKIKDKMKNLETFIAKYGHLNKQRHSIDQSILELNKPLKEIDSKIKKLNVMENDCRGSKKAKTKLKQSLVILLQTRYVECTLRLIKMHDNKVKLQAEISHKKHDTVLRLSSERLDKAHFHQQDQYMEIEENSQREYQQIEREMTKVVDILKQSALILKLHEATIQNIADNTDMALSDVEGGRRNLAEIQKREQGNRKFIIKIFIILYVFVFVYINFLL